MIFKVTDNWYSRLS